MYRRLLATIVCVAVSLSLVSCTVPAATAAERAIAVAVELPACATEGSDWCVWWAAERGNGSGNSFVVRDGVVTFVTR